MNANLIFVQKIVFIIFAKLNVWLKKHGGNRMKHDQWSLMGKEHLGDMNIRFTRLHEDGCFTLMKCILNDYWADAPPQHDGWDKDKIDMVMSKLYYCWVAMLDYKYPEGIPLE